MTTTEKKAIVDNILELLIQLTEDGDNSAPQTTKAPTAGKVEMLTIKESAALISGLSEHTVRQLVKQGKVKAGTEKYSSTRLTLWSIFRERGRDI